MGLFSLGGAPTHLLANPREAKPLLDGLRAAEPMQALPEVSNWHESLRQAQGLAPAVLGECASALDEAARAHVAKLTGEYSAALSSSRMPSARMWEVMCDYWRQAAMTHVACADLYAAQRSVAKEALGVCAVRALRALGEHMKWQYLRHGAPDSSQWGALCRLYAVAEFGGVARRAGATTPDPAAGTSPEDEFVKAAMLSSASPDALPPRAVDLVWRLAALFRPQVRISPEPSPDVAYWVDLGGALPPQRLARTPARSPTLRFLSVGALERELQQVIGVMRVAPAVPAQLAAAARDADPELLRSVLAHLARNWSHRPPERRARRHAVQTNLRAMRGYERVLSVFDPARSSEFDFSGAETWSTENVSAGGFAAVLPPAKTDRLRLGALVAVKPDGGTWLIGAVRRVSGEMNKEGRAGIETLARSVRVVQLMLDGGGEGGVATGIQPGILLDPASPDSSTEAELIIKPGTLAEVQNVRYQHEGRTVILYPMRVVEAGDDYSRVRYRLRVREPAA